MEKYALHGSLEAVPGKVEELRNILLEASELVATSEGCHLYLIGHDPDHPDAVWITEVWESEEAHDRSLEVPGVRDLIGKAMPFLQGAPVKGQSWTIMGGHGLGDV